MQVQTNGPRDWGMQGPPCSDWRTDRRYVAGGYFSVRLRTRVNRPAGKVLMVLETDAVMGANV